MLSQDSQQIAALNVKRAPSPADLYFALAAFDCHVVRRHEIPGEMRPQHRFVEDLDGLEVTDSNRPVRTPGDPDEQSLVGARGIFTLRHAHSDRRWKPTVLFMT